jgi:hypothetical protein
MGFEKMPLTAHFPIIAPPIAQIIINAFVPSFFTLLSQKYNALINGEK